jgi:hypothetical protein
LLWLSERIGFFALLEDTAAILGAARILGAVA